MWQNLLIQKFKPNLSHCYCMLILTRYISKKGLYSKISSSTHTMAQHHQFPPIFDTISVPQYPLHRSHYVLPENPLDHQSHYIHNDYPGNQTLLDTQSNQINFLGLSGQFNPNQQKPSGQDPQEPENSITPNNNPFQVSNSQTKKSLIEAFIPQSILVPECFVEKADVPSVDELMKMDSAVLRITAKEHSKKNTSKDDTTYFLGLHRLWQKAIAINAIHRGVSVEMVEKIMSATLLSILLICDNQA